MTEPMRTPLQATLERIREGVAEVVNCRKVKAHGCDCRVGGETALQLIQALLDQGTGREAQYPLIDKTTGVRYREVGRRLTNGSIWIDLAHEYVTEQGRTVREDLFAKEFEPAGTGQELERTVSGTPERTKG